MLLAFRVRPTAGCFTCSFWQGLWWWWTPVILLVVCTMGMKRVLIILEESRSFYSIPLQHFSNTFSHPFLSDLLHTCSPLQPDRLFNVFTNRGIESSQGDNAFSSERFWELCLMLRYSTRWHWLARTIRQGPLLEDGSIPKLTHPRVLDKWKTPECGLNFICLPKKMTDVYWFLAVFAIGEQTNRLRNDLQTLTQHGQGKLLYLNMAQTPHSH